MKFTHHKSIPRLHFLVMIYHETIISATFIYKYMIHHTTTGITISMERILNLATTIQSTLSQSYMHVKQLSHIMQTSLLNLKTLRQSFFQHCQFTIFNTTQPQHMNQTTLIKFRSLIIRAVR